MTAVAALPVVAQTAAHLVDPLAAADAAVAEVDYSNLDKIIPT